MGRSSPSGAEEVAFRGPAARLLQLSDNALPITGLVHAAWHLPLILLTSLYHSDGNLLIILPLFVSTIVAAGFVYGDLRIATGSIWPASIAHGVHNASWGALAALTVTSSPVLVNEYLAGDTGVFILSPRSWPRFGWRRCFDTIAERSRELDANHQVTIEWGCSAERWPSPPDLFHSHPLRVSLAKASPLYWRATRDALLGVWLA